jgi:mycothiol synthase
MTLLDLAALATRSDGVAPFNEASLLAMRDRQRPRIQVVELGRGSVLKAAAYAPGDAPVELVVAPAFRRQGIARRMVRELVADGERFFWAHGDLPGAQALAASEGLSVQRELLVLRLEFDGAPAPERHIDGVTIRTFVPSDADQIVRVNARAFAHHPEQGAMDRADFDRRCSTSWFDPAGLFVAERDGQVIGFHWTKVEDQIGEVYVVGIDPDAQGLGLGTALTARGLRHMYELGLPVVDLYVEGDNHAALAVYRKLGFVDYKRDTLYAAPEPEARCDSARGEHVHAHP